MLKGHSLCIGEAGLRKDEVSSSDEMLGFKVWGLGCVHKMAAQA